MTCICSTGVNSCISQGRAYYAEHLQAENPGMKADKAKEMANKLPEEVAMQWAGESRRLPICASPLRK